MSTVLVTGTSTGIGQATAVHLARKGHRVFATMRNPEGAPELGNIARAESLPLTVLSLDVDSDASVRAAFETVRAQAGRVDVLVNNAGVGFAGAVEDVPLSEFRRVMETNFFGALRCIKAVLPSMRESRAGLIVNVTSVAGRIASGAQGAYCASKWALEALSESLALEVAHFGVRVAIIEPGVITTPIFGKMGPSPVDSPYPHLRRLRALFAKSNETPRSPFLVAEKIAEVVASADGRLRHPVGPDAEPFLGWRRSLTDEQWVAFGGLDDDAWRERVARDFGLDLRLS
jgi:NAD(P)-dependent dehydrogenase (short-subunit alcohol dehydrogenase family)